MPVLPFKRFSGAASGSEQLCSAPDGYSWQRRQDCRDFGRSNPLLIGVEHVHETFDVVAVAEALADRDREWRDRLSWATGHGEPKQHPSDSPAWWGGQVALGIKVRQDRYHEATLQIVARLQELEVALAKSQAECRRLAACCPRCGNDDSREACAACGFDRVHDTELAAEICRDLMDADLLAGGAAKAVRNLIAEHTKGGA